MQDARPLLAAVCAALVLGMVIAMRVLLIGALESGADLIDPNLGTALARSLVFTGSSICLAAAALGSIVVVTAGPKTTHATISLLLLGACALERLWAAPTMYAAWSRVDRLAAQPRARHDDAVAQALQHDGILLAMGTLAVVSIWLCLRDSVAPRPSMSPPPQA